MDYFMMFCFGVAVGFIITYILLMSQINKLCSKIDEYYGYEIIDNDGGFDDDDDDESDWMNDADYWKRK